jgi:hypothetical protein
MISLLFWGGAIDSNEQHPARQFLETEEGDIFTQSEDIACGKGNLLKPPI